MVISCPRCEARYRLDDGRMQGRGARVVCPRCQHVFVVLRNQADEPDAHAPAATSTLSRATPGPIRVVTPGPRKQRREVATIEVQALDPTTKEAEEPAPEVLDAAALDFREVGIRTWKIKARIGLTYDFSDLSTLRRYLAQGKVGADDELSFDGSSWTRLGDIDDLDAHFIAAWKKARAAMPDEPAPSASQSTPIAEPPRSTWPEPPRSTSTSSRLTAAPDRRTGAHVAVARSGRRKDQNRQLLWGAAAVLLIAGWLLALSHTRPRQVEPPDEEAASIDAGADAIPADDLLDGADAASADPVPEPVTTPEPVVVAPTPRPGRLVAPSAWGSAPTPAPVEGKQIAGDNWYRGGLRAMQDDDYGKARDMFARAVKKAPTEPRYWEALGEAQVVLGDKEGAAVSFSRAEELGHANVGR